MDLLSFLLTNWTWIIYWSITGVALVGVILNIEHDLRCFYIWTFTNAAFATRTFFLGAYEMTALFMVYFILAIVGIYRWKTNPHQDIVLLEENERLRNENNVLREALQASEKSVKVMEG